MRLFTIYGYVAFNNMRLRGFLQYAATWLASLMNTHLQFVAVHTETTNKLMRVYVFDDAYTTRCTVATKMVLH